jgi:cytochrome P450
MRSLDDLPVFDEWEAPDFGQKLDWVADDLYQRPYQGLLRGSDGSVVVYRNADVRAISRLPQATHGSIDGMAPQWRDVLGEDPISLTDFFANTTFSMNGAKHRAHKRVVSRRLTTRSAERFAVVAQSVTQAQLERVADGSEIDFMHDVAMPLIVAFWSRLLGLEPDEGALLMQAGSEFQNAQLLAPDVAQLAAADDGAKRWLEILPTALRRGACTGGHFIPAELLQDYQQGDETEPVDPAVTFAVNMVDGFYTFSSAVAATMHALLLAPRSLARVQADRTLIPSAVMEGLRLHGAALLTQRHAADDFEYDDVFIPKDTALTMMWLFGNRDPKVFADPNKYCLDRENRNLQTTFGGGMYACAGKNVVRMLLEASLEVLTQPSVKITPTGELRWTPMSSIHEIAAMPATVRLSP